MDFYKKNGVDRMVVNEQRLHITLLPATHSACPDDLKKKVIVYCSLDQLRSAVEFYESKAHMVWDRRD